MTIEVNTTQPISIDEFDDTGGPGLRYITNPNITITIDFGVLVGSEFDGNGVESDLDGSTLINNGNVFSGGRNGVNFSGSDSAVINNGNIAAGFFNGLNMSGDNAAVTNNGTVFSYRADGVNFVGGTEGDMLTNAGEIYGLSSGVRDGSTDGATIINSGLIRSDQEAVTVITGDGQVTVITNMAGGTIRGAEEAIETVTGRISLDNRGTIVGVIDLDSTTGNVNDTIVNRGKIDGQVFLGAGNDIFNGIGNATSGKVFGEDGNDTLIGGKANNSLDGGAGLDLIRGGRGKDNLFGGDDRDIFDFNVVQDSVKGGKRDVIHDFFRGNNVTGDDIDLRTIDAKTGIGGNQKFKFIGQQDFHDKKGELRIEDKGNKVVVQGDVNGDGKADFEILVKVGTLSAGDFLL